MVLIADWKKSTYDPTKDLEVDKIFRLAIKQKCSDIHLQVGRPPVFRIRGGLRELEMAPITESQMIQLTFPMMDQRNLDIFHKNGGADYSKVLQCDGEPWRFRVNLFTQLGKVGMVARKIERSIPPFEGLYLPACMVDHCKYDQGMVLLAGVTGSGKSTTIASMLDWINRNMNKHILTIEDPIEFIYTSDKCLINQREIGQDCSYSGLVPIRYAQSDSRQYGDEHEVYRRAEAAEDDRRQAASRSHRGNHELQSHRAQAGDGRDGREVVCGHSYRQVRRHAVV